MFSCHPALSTLHQAYAPSHTPPLAKNTTAVFTSVHRELFPLHATPRTHIKKDELNRNSRKSESSDGLQGAQSAIEKMKKWHNLGNAINRFTSLVKLDSLPCHSAFIRLKFRKRCFPSYKQIFYRLDTAHERSLCR